MATEQSSEEWGNVRVKNELLEKVDEIIKKNPVFKGRSDFVTALILKEVYG